ncbi:hypothetical protein GLAREA_02442 [Glarea lozoyensis ATCC 20868]|uniref:Uncharacterized protein n=1 Tax=Glarea lozoyensis (strain ATCC 20868 / MF5171) TaxID=1116229 RepID=S3CMU1_GLAL2|nr:uncharacterized protein GLAREA_02442 [Glarea lozoyensis ATCC 20868]EPE26529.1 hypothetical protein GLAREA_02442 [Glarea lozoyensis ATCC 20868]
MDRNRVMKLEMLLKTVCQAVLAAKMNREIVPAQTKRFAQIDDDTLFELKRELVEMGFGGEDGTMIFEELGFQQAAEGNTLPTSEHEKALDEVVGRQETTGNLTGSSGVNKSVFDVATGGGKETGVPSTLGKDDLSLREDVGRDSEDDEEECWNCSEIHPLSEMEEVKVIHE